MTLLHGLIIIIYYAEIVANGSAVYVAVNDVFIRQCLFDTFHFFSTSAN